VLRLSELRRVLLDHFLMESNSICASFHFDQFLTQHHRNVAFLCKNETCSNDSVFRTDVCGNKQALKYLDFGVTQFRIQKYISRGCHVIFHKCHIESAHFTIIFRNITRTDREFWTPTPIVVIMFPRYRFPWLSWCCPCQDRNAASGILYFTETASVYLIDVHERAVSILVLS
jgi:hypothetical protein